MSQPSDVEVTEAIPAPVVRFPRARLTVTQGPNEGAEVLLEGQTVVVGSDDACQLVLKDSSVSRRHFELSGGPGGYRLRDLKSTNGVFVDGLSVMEAKLTHKLRIRAGRSELQFEPEPHEIQWPLSQSETFGWVYGKSLVMRRLFALLEKAAPTSSPVVLEGESGTGKHWLARGIHQHSSCAEGPFVVFDATAYTESKMEEALLGGRMEGSLAEASGGTLVLGEVTALPLVLQAKFARRMEEGLNVRVLATTRKNLAAEVKAGRFREDFYFLLSVFRVQVPPLRERIEDIPGLVTHFAKTFKGARDLPEEAVDMLVRHEWRGNVRELRSIVERLCVIPDLGMALLTASLDSQGVAESGPTYGDLRFGPMSHLPLLELPYHEAKDKVVEAFERTYLMEQLRLHQGVVTHAAQTSGVPRQSFHRMLRRLGLSSNEEES